MSKQAYIWPDDFKGWQEMHMVPSGFWIYFSPDNRLAAMVDVDRKEVLIISDRHTKVPIYENREKIKEAAVRAGLRSLSLKLPTGARRLV